MNQLYSNTTKARFDVSNLSFDDLLKLDYKRCTPTFSSNNNLPEISRISCGIPSIMRKYSDIYKEKKNIFQIQESLNQFQKEKNIDYVLGFAAKDTTDHGEKVKHLIVYSNKEMPSVESSHLSLINFLRNVPNSLSEQLKNDPIMLKQKIMERGILLNDDSFERSINGSNVTVIEIQENISRKSLKPIIEEWMTFELNLVKE